MKIEFFCKKTGDVLSLQDNYSVDCDGMVICTDWDREAYETHWPCDCPDVGWRVIETE